MEFKADLGYLFLLYFEQNSISQEDSSLHAFDIVKPHIIQYFSVYILINILI